MTRVPVNDLARALHRDSREILSAVHDVLESGHVVLGPQVLAFERALATYLGIGHVIGVASGTDALELAMKASMPADRTAVLTAANAGGYTTTAAVRAGYSVAYADVDPQTLCLSADTVRAALDDRVGVVVVTHLYGNLTDVRELVALCRSRGIRVIEDCAQAVGARLGDRHAGTFGDVATTSFYPTKNLGALGDGGAVYTADDGLAATLRSLRQYGWEGKYRVALAGGVNSRLDELQAAILARRLPGLDALNEQRRAIVARYRAAAEGGPLEVLPAEGRHHVAHLAVARARERDSVRAALHSAGVDTDVHFPVPDHRQAGFPRVAVALPETERAANEVITLPCFPEMTEGEIRAVCEAIGALA